MAERPVVPDASVALKWLLREAGSETALRWRDEPDVRFHVPDLWYIEIGNALWKRIRRGEPEPRPAELADLLAALASVTVTTHSGAVLVQRATALAVAARITVYDAAYVVVAEMRQATFLTADRRLVRALAGHTSASLELLGET